MSNLSESNQILEAQVKDLIRKLSNLRVEVETLKMERDLWKDKFVDLSNVTQKKESLSLRSSNSQGSKTRVPGSVTVGRNAPTDLEVDPGVAAIFIAQHPELPIKKGKEKVKATIG